MEALSPRLMLAADAAPTELIAAAEQPPLLYIDNQPEISEGNSGTTDFVFDIHLTKASSVPVTVEYFTKNITAGDGSDYVNLHSKLTFQPGETFQQVTVRVKGDSTAETDEEFGLMLFESRGALISGTNPAKGRILNDDDGDPQPPYEAPQLWRTVHENDGGVDFTIRFERPVESRLVYTYSTKVGLFENEQNKAQPGIDYVAVSGELEFLPGDTAKTFRVPLIDDDQVEPFKVFYVISGDGYSSEVRIEDDEIGTISLSAERFLRKNDQGQLFLRFLATTAPQSRSATFDFVTEDGTAQGGVHFAQTVGSYRLFAGASNVAIDVPVLSASQTSPPREFTAHISNIQNGIPGTVSATAAIQFDRQAPVVKPLKLKPPRRGSASFKATVVFQDNFSIRGGSFAAGRLYLTGPNHFIAYCDPRDIGFNYIDGAPLSVPCNFHAPGGTWDRRDNGRYVLRVKAGVFSDVAGNSVAKITLGSFFLNFRR